MFLYSQEMTSHMSMNRVIHGAVRRDLARFTGALATFPNGDAERAGELGRAWRFFYGELTRHHTGEHAIAWPAMQKVGAPAALLAEMDVEHNRMANALDVAATAMKALESSPTSAAATSAAAAVASLKLVTEEHLAHEEAELEPIYQAKKDDPVVKAMGRKFGKENPMVAGKFFAWLQEGASKEELAGLHDNVPGPILAIFGGLLGRSYRRTIAPVWRNQRR